MKKIKQLIGLALPLLFLASCSKDDTEPGGPQTPGEGGDIIFEIGFAPTAGAAYAMDGDGNIIQLPQTRMATDEQFRSTWEDGDRIGLFAVRHNNSSTPGALASDGTNIINNVPLTYSSANGGSWSGKVYWPTGGTGGVLDFYAYYPYDETAQDPTAIIFNVATDQNGTTNINGTEHPNYNLSDLLTAADDNGGNGYSKAEHGANPIRLTCSHALAMVQVTLDNEFEVIDHNEELTVTLRNVKPGATLNLGGASGPEVALAATGNEPTDIKMYRVKKPEDAGYLTKFTFRALVPAQTLPQDASIFRIINGNTRLNGSKLTADITLAGGQAETFTQRLPISVLSAQPEANSYMARPYGQALLIPVSQANRVLHGEDLGASTSGLNAVTAGNFTVELVWADTPIGDGGVVTAARPVEIDGKGYLYIKPGVEGNAVIGIKLNGEQQYRWSWHIWVTEPVTSATDTETGLTWMDRNLGAAVAGRYDPDGRNGLYYQWGRKDAFPAGDGTNNNQTYYTPDHPSGTTDNLPTGSHTELPGMVQNPLNFATNWSSYYGSVNQSGDQNNSWGGVSGTKTVYDPCLPGWKVLPIKVGNNNSWGGSEDWVSFSDNGRIFNGVGGIAGLSHFYPASAYRNANGQFEAKGPEGYYWSATAQSATYGYYLYFNSSGVTPVFSYNCANGFSVRCVAE